MSTTIRTRIKKVPQYPMDEYHSKVMGVALNNVWNNIAPGEIDASKMKTKEIVATCMEYVSVPHLTQDEGLGHIALTCLIGEHGYDKVLRWLTKEHPLGF